MSGEEVSDNIAHQVGKLETEIGVEFDRQLSKIPPDLMLDLDPLAHRSLRAETMVIRDELKQAKRLILTSGNFDVKDESRSGRPVMGKVDAILAKVELDRDIRFYNIAKELGDRQKTVLTYLKKSRFF
ncbi:hypothetical protein EVAR_65225_1 [Eumeta japonica]|uniref:Uncharacterized protein n=1 Tax=Eumeta variegata TaxID=151549 RepID=A0A4C1ZC80_EUMVA|nr:hypothetical protein EVAR_65225_1 [Eumeta japonica]